MKKSLFTKFFTTTVCGLLLFICTAIGQEKPAANPTPTSQTETKPAKAIKPRRISNIKFDQRDEKATNKTENPSTEPVTDQPADRAQVPQIAKATPEEIEAQRKAEEERRIQLEQEKIVAAQAEADRRVAADAALEREKQKAADEAAAKTKAEFEAKQRESEEKAAAERKKLADELEKTRLDAETKAAEAAKKAAEEKRELEQRAAQEKIRLEAERIEREKQAENERIERERREKEAADKEAALKLELENQRIAAEKAKQQADAENAARIEAETKAKAELERQKSERETIRKSVIENAAKNLGFLNSAAAVSLVPADMSDAAQIEAFLTDQAKKNESLVKAIDFCNTSFKGEAFTYTGTADITLGDFLDLLNNQYQVDFVPDNDVLQLPVRLNVNNKRWDNVLRSLLRQLDVQASCDGGIISLVKRTKYLAQLEDQRKNAPLKTETIRLNYLRPRSGGQVNLSGKTTNSAAPIETLEAAIRKILETDGDKRGSVSLIPGRAELFIKATEEQLREIREQIALADRKKYRIDVYGQIYAVNENRLKDVGSQISAVLSTNLSRSGGLTTLPPATNGTSGGTTGGTSGGTNNGGTVVGRNFPNGFGVPSGSLSAANPATIIGANVKVGSAEFAYQLSLLEQFGVARSIEKPFVSAKDGSTGLFENGTKIPVIIQALNNFSGSTGGSVDYIDAGTTLSVSPQIAFDENDKPRSVSLNLRLESNTPILSIQTSGDVPAVNRRAIQLDDITLIPGQTFIFGGSNNRTESNTVTRTPGLGELPVFGNLFKRKNKQISEDKIYFALTVQISEDDGESPINPMNLDTTFPAPPPANAPLKPVKIN